MCDYLNKDVVLSQVTRVEVLKRVFVTVVSSCCVVAERLKALDSNNQIFVVALIVMVIAYTDLL